MSKFTTQSYYSTAAKFCNTDAPIIHSSIPPRSEKVAVSTMDTMQQFELLYSEIYGNQ